MSTLVDILHAWAYEHYPVEILEQVEMSVVNNDNGVPIEVRLEGALPRVDVSSLSHAQLRKRLEDAKKLHCIKFNPASPTFFQDLEVILFRIWGLRACKRPFRKYKCENDKT